MTNRFFQLAVPAIFLGLASAAGAADWPMWRYDAGRTGSCPEALPADLHLKWERQLPAFEMAWPNESRLHFDASYEPVVMGKLLFVGSPADGSVRAFDTDTGQQRWRFYTEGPVRFSPAAWQGKLYVASDDGFLYCLSAEEGKVLWKVRGAPQQRPQFQHLGNNRLISYWPVRGGPVLADGTVYFAAGIWPTMGVSIVAVDAQTGQRQWINNDGNRLSQIRIDHNALHEAGLSPQGYLLINGDKLLVPNGRSFPARFDRKTGELLYYVQGYRNGDSRVTTMGKYAFVGNGGVMNVDDGREVGSRWVEAGQDAPDAFDGRRSHLFEGPLFPYKMLPACNAASVLTPEILYGMDRGVFYAYDFTRPQVSEYEKDFGGNKVKPWRWDLPLSWKAASPQAGGNPPSGVLIKAGNRLYGHAGKALVALDLPAGGAEPQIAWQQQIYRTPSSMLAADGKLFVATREGALLCFGAGPGDTVTRPLNESPLADRNDASNQTAAAILEQTKVDDGYCLVLGLENGHLVEELLGQSQLRIIAADADRELIDELRDRWTAAGLYGTRVTALIGDPFEFPFPPYLANLIVSETSKPAGFQPENHAARLFDNLRPYGGVMCLDLPAPLRQSWVDSVQAAQLPNAKLDQAGDFVLLRRDGPLPGSASWTHETADSARSYFSKDRLVKVPLGVLWYGDGQDHGFYKSKDYGVGVKPQIVGGRLFAYQIFSRTLHAIDVYTGRLLWKTQVEHFTRYASMDDGVYVAGGDQCLVLDPASGQPRQRFAFRIEGLASPQVSDIRVGGEVIVIAVAQEKVRAIHQGLWDSQVLVALDRHTGDELWQRTATHRFNNSGLAISGGTVFCTDSFSPTWTEANHRRGDDAQPELATILALDARTGKEKWQTETTNPFREYATSSNWMGVRSNDDWLAVAQKAGLLLAGRHDQLHAFDTGTGEPIWHKTIRGGQPIMVGDDQFINQAGHTYSLRTGELISGQALFVRGGCNYAVASEHLLFIRDRCASYVDLKTREKHFLRNLRSGCSNSLVAADGLLNAPCFSGKCVCNYPIQTSFAMFHMPESADWDEPYGQAGAMLRK